MTWQSLSLSPRTHGKAFFLGWLPAALSHIMRCLSCVKELQICNCTTNRLGTAYLILALFVNSSQVKTPF